MRENAEFLANHTGRSLMEGTEALKMLNFYEWMYENIKKDTQDVIDKGLTYLIEPFENQKKIIKGKLDELNEIATMCGLVELKKRGIINNTPLA